jgi:hypothetical protein
MLIVRSAPPARRTDAASLPNLLRKCLDPPSSDLAWREISSRGTRLLLWRKPFGHVDECFSGYSDQPTGRLVEIDNQHNHDGYGASNDCV